MKTGDPKQMIVWQKTMNVVEDIYTLTADFPSHELHGLVAQMRRAAVSIPSNIAEGRRRGSEKEFHYFLKISFGSASELETQIEISKRLGYLTEENRRSLEVTLTEVMKMLNVLCSTEV